MLLLIAFSSSTGFANGRVIFRLIRQLCVGAGFAIIGNFEYLFGVGTVTMLDVALMPTFSTNPMHMAVTGISGFLFIAARYDRQKIIQLVKILAGLTLPAIINAAFNIIVTNTNSLVFAIFFALAMIVGVGIAIRYFVIRDQKWIDEFLQGGSSPLNNVQKITRAMRDLFGVVRDSQVERYLVLHARRSILQKSLTDLGVPKLRIPVEEQMIVVRKKIRGNRSVIGNYCWENTKFIIPEIIKTTDEK